MTKYYIFSEHEREMFIHQVFNHQIPDPNFMFEIDVIPGYSEEFDKQMVASNFAIEVIIRGALKNLHVEQRACIDKEMFFRNDGAFLRIMEEIRRRYIDRIRTMTDTEYDKIMREVGMR